MKRSSLFFGFCVFAVSMAMLCDATSAQPPGLNDRFGGDWGGQQDEDPAQFSAYFQLASDSQDGVLIIKGEISKDWHLYSVSTPRGGPMRLKIRVPESDEYQLTGPFQPDQDPHLIYEEVFESIVEEHKNSVAWSAPIRLSDGVAANEVAVAVKLQGQVCMDSGVCVLVNENIEALFNGNLETEDLTTTFQPKRGHVIWSGYARPGSANPGETVTIELTAEPLEDYKIYAYEKVSGDSIAQPTRISLSKTNGWETSAVVPSEEHKTREDAGETQKYHPNEVTWSIEMKIPEDAKSGTYQFAGLIGYQNCTDQTCDPPSAAQFSFEVKVGESADKATKIGFAKGQSYSQAAKLGDRKAKEEALTRGKGPRNYSSDAK